VFTRLRTAHLELWTFNNSADIVSKKSGARNDIEKRIKRNLGSNTWLISQQTLIWSIYIVDHVGMKFNACNMSLYWALICLSHHIRPFTNYSAHNLFPQCYTSNTVSHPHTHTHTHTAPKCYTINRVNHPHSLSLSLTHTHTHTHTHTVPTVLHY
jgi:hypothetical protein